MEQGIQEVIEMVKTASPALWTVARQQVAAEKMIAMVGVLVGLVCVCGAFYAASKARGDDMYDAFPLWTTGAALGGLVGPVVMIIAGCEFLRLVVAPDYAALKALSDLVVR